MILKKNLKDKLYLQINDFKIDEDMEHLFSTRIGWDQADLLEGISQIFQIKKDKIYNASQVHGIDLEIIEDQKAEEISMKKLDGLISNKRGIALVTYHADCLPLYFYDRVKKVIGLAHSGWKGSLNNIAKAMIDALKSSFNSNLEDIVVAIGPSIGPCCYEIGRDVEGLFNEKFTDIDDIIIARDDKLYLDLRKVNRINLLNRGIKNENIVESSFCTACNTDILYSYRKENTKDRMIASIRLKA